MTSVYQSTSPCPVRASEVECAYPSPSSDDDGRSGRRPLSVPREPQYRPRSESSLMDADRPSKLKGSPQPDDFMHPPSPRSELSHLDPELGVSDPLIEHLIRGVEVWRDNSIRTIEARATAYLHRLGGIRSDPGLVARLHLARRKMQLDTGKQKRSMSVPARRRQGSAESQRVLAPRKSNEADRDQDQMDVEEAVRRARRMSA